MERGQPLVMAVLHYKGGQGKTTTLFQFAGALAARGLEVLCLDTDAQGNLTQTLLGSDVFDALEDGDAVTALFDPRTTAFGRLVRPTKLPRVSLVPASRGLHRHNIPEPGRQGWAETAIDGFVRAVYRGYDAILLDTPPTLQLLTWAALMASDFCYTPLIPEPPSVQGILEVKGFVEELRDGRRPGLHWLGLVLNRVKPKAAIHQVFSRVLAETHPADLLGAFLPDAVAFPESLLAAEPLATYRPRCAAAAAVQQVVEELGRRGRWDLPAVRVAERKTRRAA